MFVELIDLETRLCVIDETALISSKYDSESKSGKSTRLGYFKGYKFHCIAAVTDIIIPLVFDLTTANIYDNQVYNSPYKANIYNPFLILADAAYDSAEWFKIASYLELNLLTDINLCKAKSIESFSHKRYENDLFMQSLIGLELYKN
ncbi:transposase [Clostridium butyricum]|uniref:transposase n=1 Tax=Clostridium butyricum TaxID=1492 RepID=UPI003467350F